MALKSVVDVDFETNFILASSAAAVASQLSIGDFETSPKCQIKLIGVIFNFYEMVEKLIDDVLKIIDKFSELINKKNSCENNFKHINIEVIKENDYYVILITHCNLKNIDYLNCIADFLNLIKRSLSQNNEKIILVILKESNNDNEFTLNCSEASNGPTISQKIHYPHLNEYLTIKIKQQLSSEDFEKFENTIIEHLKKSSNVTFYTKYAFYYDGQVIYKNQTKVDEIFNKCTLLGSTMSEIITLSLDFDFIKKSCEELSIEDPGKAADASTMKLFSLFQKQYNIYRNS